MSNPPFRHYSMFDRLLSGLDQGLNNIFCEQKSSRPYPAKHPPQPGKLTTAETRLSAGLMRVNHAGEIAAQALYHGQSLTARNPALREKLHQASIEESDHLNWCRHRLKELDARPSYLDPLWYAGSLCLGVAAGVAGDRWNLAFLAETERQVVRHLGSHLKRLPAGDWESRAIVSQMREDEQRHAALADSPGAARLPGPVKSFMRFTARMMTTAAERI